jgi:hypothetical protein
VGHGDDEDAPGGDLVQDPASAPVLPPPVPEPPQQEVVDRKMFGPFTDDLWDVSRGQIEITDHSGLGAGHERPYDIRSLFGFAPEGVEPPLILFEKAAPGTVHWVEWELPQAIELRSIFLKAGHEKMSRDRSFQRFTLYARQADTGRQIKVFEIEPAHPYAHTSAPPYAAIKDDIHCDLVLRANVVPVKARQFRAEFEQGGGETSTAYGPRIMELDGFDSFCPDIPHPPLPPE